MINITKKKQLYFDFGRDYEASLENFFFSSKKSLLSKINLYYFEQQEHSQQSQQSHIRVV